jgi:hypothetical protein
MLTVTIKIIAAYAVYTWTTGLFFFKIPSAAGMYAPQLGQVPDTNRLSQRCTICKILFV